MKIQQLCFVITTAYALSGCGGGDSESPASGSGETSVTPPVVTPPVVTPPVVTPPVSKPAAPTFAKQPESVTQAPYATVEFSAPKAQSYRCQLNEEPSVECSSPYLIYPLSAKSHQFSIWTIAADGGESDPTTIKWIVESIFPSSPGARVHADVIPTTVQPAVSKDNSWRGIFRINCDLSHSDYIDPIVFPGLANAAHLHSFYGNLLLDEHSTTGTLFSNGESSCQGNTLNRSAYWVPSLLAPSYDAKGQRLLDDQGEPAWVMVPAVVGGDDEAHEVFYYSAGVDDLSSIQPIPLGLKMIAGSMMGEPGQEQSTSIVRWHCQTWESSDAQNPRWSASVPNCAAPDRVRMDVFFPSCWNGLDLDSEDHKSHLAYPAKSSGTGKTICPSTHPVPIIRVSFHYAYGVKPDVYDPKTRSSAGWRLSSDMYEVTATAPGGMSLHADWFNAWHPEALQKILDVCIRQQLDCHDGNLGNGYRLSGTRPGSQNTPPIINKGLGY